MKKEWRNGAFLAILISILYALTGAILCNYGRIVYDSAARLSSIGLIILFLLAAIICSRFLFIKGCELCSSARKREVLVTLSATGVSLFIIIILYLLISFLIEPLF